MDQSDAFKNSVPKSIFTDQVKELVALGAAFACNCEVCFKYHYDKARKLGISREDMSLAVNAAKKVKVSLSDSVTLLAEKYLQTQ